MQTQLLQFCKDAVKASSILLQEIATKSTYFFSAKKKIPILWTEPQINKNRKVFKTVHLNTEP